MPATHWYQHKIFKYSFLLLVAAWLITLSFIIDNYWSKNATISSAKKNVADYIQQQKEDFNKIAADSLGLKNFDNDSISENSLKEISKKKYFFYVYQKNDTGFYALKFWSTQVILPDDSLLKNSATEGFTQMANGFYVWEKKEINNKLVIQLIPIKWNYAITNEYLKNNLAYSIIIGDAYDISTNEGLAVTGSEGQPLFYIAQHKGLVIQQNNDVSILLRVLSVLFIFTYIYLLCRQLVIQHKPILGVLTFTLLLVLLRMCSYFFPIPANFRQFELFDPKIYGSSASILLQSLGDLLINVLLFSFIVWFAFKYLKHVTLGQSKKYFKWAWLIGSSIALVLLTFFFGNTIRSLVSDSQISFDVINFFTLNRYSIVGFFILSAMVLGFFYFSQLIISIIKNLFQNHIVILPLACLIAGLLFLTVKLIGVGNNFELYLLVWLLIYLFLSVFSLFKINVFKLSSTKFIAWLFFFSISVSAIIINTNEVTEFEKRKHYAETLAAKVSPSSETLMNTLLTDFRNDVLAPNFDRFKKEQTAQVLIDSLTGGNFTSLTNKYDTRIFCFDQFEKPLFNKDSSSFNTLNAIFSAQAKPTGIPDLYYYDEAFDRFNYIAKKTVTDTATNLLGYVFIVASPKNTKADALYPELFSRGEHNAIENSAVYAFAVYNNYKLVMHHNDYPFATELNKKELSNDEFVTKQKNDYSELWYKAGVDKMVVIAKQQRFFLESITLFSYIFCSLLLLTALFWLLRALIKLRLNIGRLKKVVQVSIRNQVHGTIIFIIIISFLVIGAGTILFFYSRYENNNREKLSRTIGIMEKEVRNSLAEVIAFDDVINVYDDAYKSKLEQTIKRVSEIHAADVNVYDLDGNLQVSSLALPYQKGIISNKMNPLAFYHLHHNKEVQYFMEEKIGSLTYLSNYIPVLDEKGKVYAYLNIPYFTSETKLRQEISNFLVTIINLNAFIFLIAGVLALFITNRITRSFALLSDRMKDVKLGNPNAVIAWNRNDEIGQLVGEYNKMVSKLDESAELLAKTEREGAWREMARQVAHEIRNPLTPMKLSLQYLQKAIDNNAPNINELTASVTHTLVDQIEHLNSISAGFLQFANIDNPTNISFNINDVIKKVAAIHSLDDNAIVITNLLQVPVIVHADATHINRLFTNLIQNAVQAVENKKAIIHIDEKLESNHIILSVKDNGSGINKEAIEKIFTPNFTTKTSGSGLGLAMCKGIVEKANGKIWFESSVGEGTIFYVELPVVG